MIKQWLSSWELSVWDLVAQVPMPKETVIENFRLGLFYRGMQACMALFIFREFIIILHPSYPPTGLSIEFWTLKSGGGGAGDDVLHCTDAASYAYVYDAIWQYSPSGCREMMPAEDTLKTLDSLFLMTNVQEHHYWAGECSSVSEANCIAARRRWAAAGDGQCNCTLDEEYFVKNQELTMVGINHGYVVPTDASIFPWNTEQAYLRGSSQLSFAVEGIPGHEEKVDSTILTVFQRPDKKPCEVAGQSQWGVADSKEGIVVPLKDLLACGGYSLDDRSERTKNGDREEGAHLRLTGARITLEMTYLRSKKPWMSNHGYDFTGVVCEIVVMVIPAWNSRIIFDHTAVPGPSGNAAAHLRRYSYGVSLQFRITGSFATFSFDGLVGGIVNAIVLMGMPKEIVRFIALYLVGVVSAIYYNVLREPFCIFRRFHGLSARMMVSAVGFRALTQQSDVPTSELKPLSQEDVEKHMTESFLKEISDGVLSEEEIAELACVVVAGLDDGDVEGAGEVSFDEFVHACSSNEALSSRTMVAFFDQERKRSLLEIIFDDTRSQIKALAKKKGTYVRETRLTGRQRGSAMKATRCDADGWGEDVELGAAEELGLSTPSDGGESHETSRNSGSRRGIAEVQTDEATASFAVCAANSGSTAGDLLEKAPLRHAGQSE